MLALTKSHRTSKDKELIGWHSDAHRLREVEKRYGTRQAGSALSTQGKKAKINGLEQRKLSDFVGSLNVVMFAPEDLEIVKGTPGVRRRFLDMEIGQVQPGYLHALRTVSQSACAAQQLPKASSRKLHSRPCSTYGICSLPSMVLKL